ncbi:murein transglycosylase A [candidate division CSSED10-310 bacterium]|uniref:peptidoglycan lytic exotransglycosylase n=1 Tax=candidate division CSSED10-310 bacterium TaxID=2855610 RepID=A0ABV6Z582_UNCC1
MKNKNTTMKLPSSPPRSHTHHKLLAPVLALLFLCLIIYFTLSLIGCPPEEEILTLVEAPLPTLFQEDLDDPAPFIQALDKQIRWFQRRIEREKSDDKKKIWQFGVRQVNAPLMLKTLQTFKEVYQKNHHTPELRKNLIKLFDFYKMGGNVKNNVLFTGYYTPIIKATLKPDQKFKFPLYRLPDDLIKVNLSLFSKNLANKYITGRYDATLKQFLPYYTRDEIDWAGKLAGRGLEIAYLADYIDQFFLHIQGGGILEIPGGEMIHVNYAGKNGRRFVGTGRLLLKDGEISKDLMSMQAIRQYFQNHPEKIRHYCSQNESYVFYVRDKSGPYGSIGLIITPGRAIATDKKFFTGGAVCLISARIPIPETPAKIPLKQKAFARFVLDQDTGGAIVGNHVDLYCGAGETAALQAGSMNAMGDVYMLLLKE